jgi:hypothetical protein
MQTQAIVDGVEEGREREKCCAHQWKGLVMSLDLLFL